MKPPANFAAELAAAQEEEHARAQVQRSARRKEVRHSAPTSSSGAVLTGRVGGRSNPSQRYQEEQARQQHQQQQQQQRADRERIRNSTSSALEVHGRPARRVDPDVKRVMLQVVDYADTLDGEYNLFADPVTEDIAPGYFQLIQHPVDLRTVR